MAGKLSRIFNFYNRNSNSSGNPFIKSRPRPSPLTQKINVNDINNLNSILLNNGIDIINNKNNYIISNNFNQDLFLKPYGELIYPDNANSINYVYVSQDNVIETILETDLYIDDSSAQLNKKRFWMANMTISLIVSYEDTEQFPKYKYLKFLNPNYDSTNSNSPQTLNVYATFKKKTTSAINNNSSFYTETQVNRTSAFIYYPLKTIYTLINLNDPNNVKIYIMQSLTNLINTTINSTNLCYLQSLLTLPDNWLFSIVLLDSKTSIILTANSTTPAYVLQDDLDNSYQYVPPSQASFLYDQFNNT